MAREMTVSDARASLSEVIEQVTAGEEVTLTRHGAPVAVIVRPDRLRSRHVDETMRTSERIRDLIADARSRPLTTVDLSADELRERLAQARAERVRGEHP